MSAPTSSSPADLLPPREMFKLLTPSECSNWTIPEGFQLVGDSHVVRGSVTVIGGAPGCGKSRASVALAIAGATGQSWFGLPVHERFKTVIIQKENGRLRLKKEFAEIGCDNLDDWIRITEPPPRGLAFNDLEFRLQLADALAAFKPGVVVIDPWNGVAKDDGQKDYLAAFDAIRAAMPQGPDAPAVTIIAHTRKPKAGENGNGRSLIHDLTGSYSIGSVARCVFVMRHASDDETDDRIVWSCCKNNDGELGASTAWHRRNGLFAPVEGFNFEEFDNPVKESGSKVKVEHLQQLFDNGRRRMAKAQAVEELMTMAGCKQSAAYNALQPSGRFGANITKDRDGLLGWKDGA